MPALRLALAALALSALPATAAGISLDLPRIDFGKPAPVSQGCANPLKIGTATGCKQGG